MSLAIIITAYVLWRSGMSILNHKLHRAKEDTDDDQYAYNFDASWQNEWKIPLTNPSYPVHTLGMKKTKVGVWTMPQPQGMKADEYAQALLTGMQLRTKLGGPNYSYAVYLFNKIPDDKQTIQDLIDVHNVFDTENAKATAAVAVGVRRLQTRMQDTNGLPRI